MHNARGRIHLPRHAQANALNLRRRGLRLRQNQMNGLADNFSSSSGVAVRVGTVA